MNLGLHPMWSRFYCNSSTGLVKLRILPVFIIMVIKKGHNCMKEMFLFVCFIIKLHTCIPNNFRVVTDMKMPSCTILCAAILGLGMYFYWSFFSNALKLYIGLIFTGVLLTDIFATAVIIQGPSDPGGYGSYHRKFHFKSGNRFS